MEDRLNRARLHSVFMKIFSQKSISSESIKEIQLNLGTDESKPAISFQSTFPLNTKLPNLQLTFIPFKGLQ
ncbi:MAG: hypothetical protein H7A24_15940 [Leptospiraceae bacterium]|nr:hypothetical protein [Leptospiraceae bacterium]MCP5513378.1 hypothetical protein [Leptospiraceae bacterium]